MLITKKLPQGSIYPQLTHAPITSYADFLNHFRGGHTIDDNLSAPVIQNTVQYAMFTTAVNSGHLTKTKNMAIPDESLADICLTKPGSELIQSFFDRTFCEAAIAEARKSVAEDNRLHPYVGVVVVKDGKILATGFRGESGDGNHGEYCALKKLSADEIQGATVYTTLEPCSSRKPPKKPCTQRLIEGRVARVVYGMADKHESVYGHSSLVEASIEIGFFSNDLMPELLALNKKWSDSLRTEPITLPNDTKPIATVTYYKPGTSMADNTNFSVRPPDRADRPYTVEDASRNVLASGRTLQEISVEWKGMDTRRVVVEGLIRQTVYSSHPLLNLP
jgi:pyrimidine deaminase RibD-like protein